MEKKRTDTVLFTKTVYVHSASAEQNQLEITKEDEIGLYFKTYGKIYLKKAAIENLIKLLQTFIKTSEIL